MFAKELYNPFCANPSAILQICQQRNNNFILKNGGLQVRKLVWKIWMKVLIVFPWLLQCSAWHRNLYRQLEAVAVITLSCEMRDG